MVKILPNCSGLTFEEESTTDFDLNAMLKDRGTMLRDIWVPNLHNRICVRNVLGKTQTL